MFKESGSEKKRLETREQIQAAMEDALRAASSKEDAEKRIKAALQGQPFSFLGPMLLWTDATGSEGALLKRLGALSGEKKRALAKKMLTVLDVPLNEREAATQQVVESAPPLSEEGVDMIDLTETISTRTALVHIRTMDGKEFNVEGHCEVTLSTEN